MSWYFTVVLTWISLTSSLLAICTFSLEEYLLNFFACLSLRVFAFLLSISEYERCFNKAGGRMPRRALSGIHLRSWLGWVGPCPRWGLGFLRGRTASIHEQGHVPSVPSREALWADDREKAVLESDTTAG